MWRGPRRLPYVMSSHDMAETSLSVWILLFYYYVLFRDLKIKFMRLKRQAGGSVAIVQWTCRRLTPFGSIKLMKGKSLKKHSLHEKTTASVLLKLFYLSLNYLNSNLLWNINISSMAFIYNFFSVRLVSNILILTHCVCYNTVLLHCLVCKTSFLSPSTPELNTSLFTH